MASYTSRGLPNEYDSHINVDTYPDSDESDSSDSDGGEYAQLVHGRHTVALDGNLNESEVQRGLYNRHNFLVKNYNNVLDHNYMQLRMIDRRMAQLLPIGGVRSRHLSSRFERRNFENLVVLSLGWMTGCVPPLLMIFVAYSNCIWFDFASIYFIFTLLICHLLSLYLISDNAKIFLKSPFMVPVLITSAHLKGLQNNFCDVTIDDFKALNNGNNLFQSKHICDIMNYMTLIDEDEYTVRVMFYSQEYFQKYIVVPRNRFIQLVLLTAFCFVISTVTFIRDIDKHHYGHF